jgi:hypothetical protein
MTPDADPPPRRRPSPHVAQPAPRDGSSGRDGGARRATDPRVAAATTWAVGVLALATLALGVLAVVVVLLFAEFASAFGVTDASAQVPGELFDVLVGVAPGVLAAWGVGLVTARVLGLGSGLRPWVSGVLSGVAGCLVGVLLLRLTGAW